MKSLLVLLPFLFSAVLFGQSNGLFQSSLSKKGTKVVTQDISLVYINLAKEIKIQRMFIFSLNNENTDFYVEVIIDKLPKNSEPVLAANGKYYRSIGSGSDWKIYNLSFRVNQLQAEEIGKAFNVPCNFRKHFGHQLEYAFIPLKDNYKAGDSIYVKLMITNKGQVPVWYNHGGMYRNENGRCDYFYFEVYYNDILLPDEGPEFNFGGLEAHPELKPGQTDSLTECITKWSPFRKAGKYTVKCFYRMHLHSEYNVKDYPDNQEDMHKAWDEKAEKTIEIIVKE
jgi:hypothetical protein